MSMWVMLVNKSGEAECRGAADVEDTVRQVSIDDAEAVKRAEQNDGPTKDQVQKKCLVTSSPTWSITGSCRHCTTKRKRDGAPKGGWKALRARETHGFAFCGDNYKPDASPPTLVVTE